MVTYLILVKNIWKDVFTLDKTSGHALRIWLCRRELCASKSAGFSSTKSLKICGFQVPENFPRKGNLSNALTLLYSVNFGYSEKATKIRNKLPLDLKCTK